MPKINVSFKQTTHDTKLYLYVMQQEEKSEFIKKCIEYYLTNCQKQYPANT